MTADIHSTGTKHLCVHGLDGAGNADHVHGVHEDSVCVGTTVSDFAYCLNSECCDSESARLCQKL